MLRRSSSPLGQPEPPASGAISPYQSQTTLPFSRSPRQGGGRHAGRDQYNV
jgi:hypothetical protein